MKTLVLIISLTFSFVGFTGTGHGHGHSHGKGHSHSHGPKKVSIDQTKEIGKKQVKRLVREKKLDSSWLEANYDKSEKKTFKGKREWVVTFKNERGVKGKKLYVFLTLTGEFVAANFSGK